MFNVFSLNGEKYIHIFSLFGLSSYAICFLTRGCLFYCPHNHGVENIGVMKK